MTSAPMAAVGMAASNFFRPSRDSATTILAMHAAQHRVTAGLQRNVRVLRDARRRGDESDEFAAPVHGLDAGDAEFFKLSLGEMGPDEGFKNLAPGLRAPAPGRLVRTSNFSAAARFPTLFKPTGVLDRPKPEPKPSAVS